MTSLYIAKSFRSGYNEFAIKEVLIMNIKNALKGLALSIISLAVGFAALAIPFKLYMAFSGGTLWAFFAFEIAAYALLACGFICIRERQKAKKKKREQRFYERKQKIRQVKSDWIDIAA